MESKLSFLLAMVESKASPPLFAMVGPTMPINIKEKKKKKRGSQSPPLLVKLPCPPMPKTQKRKEKKKKGCILTLE